MQLTKEPDRTKDAPGFTMQQVVRALDQYKGSHGYSNVKFERIVVTVRQEKDGKNTIVIDAFKAE